MQDARSSPRQLPIAIALAGALLLGSPAVADEFDFDEALARVDAAIASNPSHVFPAALESCRGRRDNAVELYYSGQAARAERSLKYCFRVLKIPETAAPTVRKSVKRAPTPEEIQAQAAREVEKALSLTPDVARGLEIYRECAGCHLPEGWGLSNGSVPQIAGQHRTVVIKQLSDIRAGNRDALLMLPYASVEAIGGTQAVADVAGYIDTLEISVETTKGPGEDLELGAKLYAENCARCHGPEGEGDAQAFVPRIQSQQYGYLVRQFEWIRDGKRRNANAEMVAQIQDFDDHEIQVILDYVSRLEPPAELQAPAGWQNPDFPHQLPY